MQTKTWMIGRRGQLALSLFALGAVWWVADTAQAGDTECGDDGDCDHGFVCETFQGACPDIAYIDEDGEVRSPECDQTQSACVPAECESDDECGDDMVCVEQGYWEASESRCTYRWHAPCEQDADCGEGFNCVEQESCWCSGSSGGSGTVSDPGDRESSTPVEPEATNGQEEPDCGCEPSGEFACELQELPCEDESECPSGWDCAPAADYAVCDRPVSGGGNDSSAGNDPATDGAAGGAATLMLRGDAHDGTSGDFRCGDVEDAPTVCQPPSYALYGSTFGEAGRAVADSADAPSTTLATDAIDDGSSGSGESSSGCHVGSLGAGAGSALGLWWMALTLGALRRRARR